ncbi:uncharacterized protein LOC129611420 [Condylostylus longicornis]|uniref:uncharacterized protein LOC129611420 n=1 Tax=Condylostylus longicornis TaxID=2530218 RepID=UPI00244DBFC4|nr:uncharacterized protein LOC129611420 [Condylostylus longicornis]
MYQLNYLSLIFIASINYCLCATFIDFNALHKDHPGKCYDSETKHAFSPNEIYKPIGRCLVLDCIKPGYVQGSSCGKVILPDDCIELEGDLTKPHPYCCDEFLCSDEHGKKFIYNPSIPPSSTNSNKIIDERNDNYL